jgi:hypothetical protein
MLGASETRNEVFTLKKDKIPGLVIPRAKIITTILPLLMLG